MREKYESLSLATLKELAKARGLKKISTLRKQELVERMLQEDERDKGKTAVQNPEEEAVQGRQESAGQNLPEAVPLNSQETAVQNPEREAVQDSPETAPLRRAVQQDTLTARQNMERTEPQSDSETVRQNPDGQEEKTVPVPQPKKYIYTRNPGYVREGGRREYAPRREYDRRRGQDNRRSYDNTSRKEYDTPKREYDSSRRDYDTSKRDYDTSKRDYDASKREYDAQKRDYDASRSGDSRRFDATKKDYDAQERSYDAAKREYDNQGRNYDAAARSYDSGRESDSRKETQPAKRYYEPKRETDLAQGEYNSADSASETGKTYDSSAKTYGTDGDNADAAYSVPAETAELDSGEKANGILEVMPDGYGFIRCENYLPGDNDVYVSPSQIRRFNLKTGDIIQGNIRIKTQGEKFSALLFVSSINGFHPSEGQRRCNFEDMTPIFPNQRLVMERPGGTTAMRIVDLLSPIGKGQRGMIVSPPKAGKTTLLKDVARSILMNNRDMHLIILLIDERPEEVTDIKEAIQGPNVEVIYSTFDELPEHHKRVSEMVIERARRLVEHKKDVTILLDSITRLARAYNMIVPPSGRTLSGGLDPTALHMPKRFFGAARNMREGGSLTILATALVDTGSKMDDVVYEEFKGTGNMELVLDRKLQEKRVFPAIDIQKSGTRREDLLLTREEQDAVYIMRRALNGMKSEDAVEQILNMFARTRTNAEFVQMVKKQKFL